MEIIRNLELEVRNLEWEKRTGFDINNDYVTPYYMLLTSNDRGVREEIETIYGGSFRLGVFAQYQRAIFMGNPLFIPLGYHIAETPIYVKDEFIKWYRETIKTMRDKR